MQYGILTITYPDGRQEQITLDGADVRIGREAGVNALVLDDSSVSRRHAQIICGDDGSVQVVDLGSGNGTYLDGQLLAADTLTLLLDGALLEMGRVQIRFVRSVVAAPPQQPGDTTRSTVHGTGSKQPDSTTTQNDPQPAADRPAPVLPQPTSGTSARPFSLEFIDPDQPGELRVRAGTEVVLALLATNRSNQVTDFAIAVHGLPAGWIGIEPVASFSLTTAGRSVANSQPVQVRIAPPQHARSQAGQYNCRIVATSTTHPGFEDARELTITVLPFIGFEAELLPRRASVFRRGNYRLGITNIGNCRRPFQINPTDEEERLEISPVQQTVALDPGERQVVALAARPRWWLPLGRRHDYTLLVKVTPEITKITLPPVDVADDVPTIRSTKPQDPLPSVDLTPEAAAAAPVREYNAQLTVTPLPLWLLLLLPLLLLFAFPQPQKVATEAIWGPTATMVVQPTPAPTPGPTTRLARGPIERTLELQGWVAPVNMQTLSFRRPGIVSDLVSTTATISQGVLVAALRQEEQQKALDEAKARLAKAQADLAKARAGQQEVVAEAEQALAQAQQDRERLLPGQPDDLSAGLQQQIQAASEALTQTMADLSTAKTNAEIALGKAADDLRTAQQRFDQAYWENQWVEENGTDPSNPTELTGDEEGNVGRSRRRLNDVEKKAFRDALTAAERDMQANQRALEQAQDALDRARQQELDGVRLAQNNVSQLQQKLASFFDEGNKPRQMLDAERAVEAAQEQIDKATETDFAPFEQAIADAQRAINEAQRKLVDGLLFAPRSGLRVLSLVSPGQSVQTDQPVVGLADDVADNYEIAADLTDEQLVLLANAFALTATISLPPDNANLAVPLSTTQFKAWVRQLPTRVDTNPAGGAGQRQYTVRFRVDDPAQVQRARFNAPVRLNVVIERQDNALLLPTAYVRAVGEGFEVLVYQPDRSIKRVVVGVGIRTPNIVQILPNGTQLEAGAIVVAP